MGLREPDEIGVAWTEIPRAQHQRDNLKYASDLRDAEWALIASLLPEKKRPGRPRRTDLRRVMEAILHIVTTGLPMAAVAPALSDLHDRTGLFLPLDPREEMGKP